MIQNVVKTLLFFIVFCKVVNDNTQQNKEDAV